MEKQIEQGREFQRELGVGLELWRPGGFDAHGWNSSPAVTGHPLRACVGFRSLVGPSPGHGHWPTWETWPGEPRQAPAALLACASPPKGQFSVRSPEPISRLGSGGPRIRILGLLPSRTLGARASGFRREAQGASAERGGRPLQPLLPRAHSVPSHGWQH